ncbi:MAG: 23S rRNA (uracil(1939)-C(5))-methyltransferase RlmD [Candidatus Cyclobacteriaceae bacterium M3_2C_046]
MVKKSEVIEQVIVEEMVAEGKCLSRIDNQVVFISGVAPGDCVDLKIRKKKKNYAEAYPLRIHSFSTLRQSPFCQHFGMCGGCKWQHLEYQAQLNYKQQQVKDSLERIGKVNEAQVQPILGSPDTTFYRNKLEYTFTSQRWLTTAEIQEKDELDRRGLGFHMPGRFDKILDIDQCYLQPEPSNAIRLGIKAFAREHDLSFYDVLEHQGFLRNLIIRTSNLQETMVILQVAQPDQSAIDQVMHFLQLEFPQITSLYYVINQKRNETIFDQELILFAGKPYITEQMEELFFRIGPKSFFQTNSKQALVLYQKARELAGLTGSEVVYDLYTGTGTIANFVAANSAKVVGLEVVPEAIEDAWVNARANHIDNVAFLSGDMKDLLDDQLVRLYGHPDVVITDPPRAGMHQQVVEQLLRMEPEKIVYVSCNPATQARDVALMHEKYQVSWVQPVDMFPHTHHVENIILLKRRTER